MKPSEIKVGVWYVGHSGGGDDEAWHRIVTAKADDDVAYWCEACLPGVELDGHDMPASEFAAWAVRPVPAPRPAEDRP